MTGNYYSVPLPARYGGSSSYGSFGGGFGGGGGGGRFGGKSQPGGNLRRPDWSSIKLTPIQKDFYQPLPQVQSRSQSEIDAYRASKEVTLRGNMVPAPMLEFSDCTMPDYILSTIK